MGNFKLDSFTTINRDLQVGRGQENKPQGIEKGSLFGRLFRPQREKDVNTGLTREFRQALVEKYGERVTQWAFSGYESRLTDGKPLSGHRIKQIVAKAEEALAKDVAALNRLVGERAPLLLDRALERAGVHLPEGTSGDLRKFLEKEVRDEIRGSEKFKNPRLLQTHVFNDEFAGVVDGIVAKYRDAIPHVGAFEQKRNEIREQISEGNVPLPEPQDGFTWGKGRLKELETCFFPSSSLKDFLLGFGEGEDKVGNIDDYFSQKVLPKAREEFERKFGVRNDQGMESYGIHKDQKINNGSYSIGKEMNRPFYDVSHMSLTTGEQGGMTRDEKFHISVPPEHLQTAFKALAPILVREDCPFKLWKVVDIEDAMAAYEKNKWPLAKRVYESCQFTLYMSNGKDEDGKSVGEPQKGEDFVNVLRDIERALSEAGVPTVGTPGSDEPVGKYVSFRMERVVLTKDDPGYDEARLREQERQGREIPDGEPVEVEPDRTHTDDNLKAKFRESPDFQPFLGLSRDLYTDETQRLRETLDNTGPPVSDDDKRAFLKLAGEVNQLGKSIDRLERNLSGKDWDDLNGGKTQLQSQLSQRLDGELGITQDTEPGGLTKFAQALPEFGELMLEFSRPGRDDDSRMLERLQRAMVTLEEIGRDLRGETPPYLAFVRSEMTRMLNTCHENLGTSPNLRLVSDSSRILTNDAPVHESMQEAMKQVEQSNLDGGAKRQMLDLLALAGRLMSASSDVNVPIEARLRMAGELESLQDTFGTLISSERDKLDDDDVDGRRNLINLRLVPFTPDLAGIVDQFRQLDGSEIPTDREAWSEDFRRLGVALEEMDRGLPLIDEEVSDLNALLETMNTFFDGTWQPTRDFQPMSQRLHAEVKRLQEFVDRGVQG